MMKIGEIDPNHVIESAVRLGIIAVLIMENDEPTGIYPGRLIRGQQA
jgi:hypothetical protein